MCHRDAIDHNDLVLEFITDQLPIDKIDLRSYCTKVYDQENMGANAVNAVAMCFQYHKEFIPSRLFMYYNARVREGTVSQDTGSSVRSVLNGLRDAGVCHEINYPYLESHRTYQPSKRVYSMAADNKTSDKTLYARIPQELRQIKQCLIEGHPFVFGISVYESFLKVKSSGLVPVPKNGEKLLGDHCMFCLGFDEKRKVFIVRNSWGPEWGDQGHCYIPYEYMVDFHNVYDLWTFYEHKIPQVTKVMYETDDVTTRFLDHFKSGKTSINISNETFGDPNPGSAKKLQVTFANGANLEYNEDTTLYFNELQTTPCDFKHITKVLYGNECGHSNVTAVFKKHFMSGQSSALITSQLFGDPVPEQHKKMIIGFQNGSQWVFDENQTITLSSFLSTGHLLRMTDIHLVLYGKDEKNRDVTQIVRNHFSRGQVELMINNQLFGDPYPNVRKELQIDSYNEKTKILPEDGALRLSDLNGYSRGPVI
jgi:hypothetical protein